MCVHPLVCFFFFYIYIYRGKTGEELGGHLPAAAKALFATPPHQPGDTAALTRRFNARGAAAEGLCSPTLLGSSAALMF